jgi:hypothetical protein
MTTSSLTGGECPDDEELDALFLKVMMDTMDESRALQLCPNVSRENKWAMVMSREKSRAKINPKTLITKLLSREDSFMDSNLVSSLRIEMTNQSISYIRDFVSAGGCEIMARSLKDVYDLGEERVKKEWLRTLHAFTNNNVGLEEVSTNQDLLNSLSLFITDEESKLIPLNILTAVAYTSSSANAVQKILSAMSYRQRIIDEENRFETFIRMLAMDCQEDNDDLSILDSFIFINALLENIEDVEDAIISPFQNLQVQASPRVLPNVQERRQDCADSGVWALPAGWLLFVARQVPLRGAG